MVGKEQDMYNRNLHPIKKKVGKRRRWSSANIESYWTEILRVPFFEGGVSSVVGQSVSLWLRSLALVTPS